MNPDNIANLHFLLSHKPGARCYADSEGKIKKASLWRRIRWFFSPAIRKKNEAALDLAINGVVASQSELFLSDPNSWDTLSELLDKLSTFPERVYKRHYHQDVYNHYLIQKGALNDFGKEIEALISLGCVSRLAAGNSGSYVVKKPHLYQGPFDYQDEKMSPAAIFKPKDEEPLAPKNPYFFQRIKRFFYKLWPSLFGKGIFYTSAGQGYIAEKATKHLSDETSRAIADALQGEHSLTPLDRKLLVQMSQIIVPDVEIISARVPGKKQEQIGSIQRWELNTAPLNEVFNTNQDFSPNKGSTPLPAVSLQIIGILDLLTQQKDRHSDNILIKKDSEGNPDSLFLIDNADALSPFVPVPGELLTLRNRFLWGNAEIANEPLSSFTKEVIRNLLSDDSYREIRGHIESLYIENEETQHLQKRLENIDTYRAILLHAANSDEITLKMLSKLKTTKDLEQHTKHYHIIVAQPAPSSSNNYPPIPDGSSGLFFRERASSTSSAPTAKEGDSEHTPDVSDGVKSRRNSV